jgi:peptide/nickel transport system substrate-binding protein
VCRAATAVVALAAPAVLLAAAGPGATTPGAARPAATATATAATATAATATAAATARVPFSHGRPRAMSGGTVYFAEPPQSAPNFIFPFMNTRLDSVVNTADFQYLMYRPLYWFGDAGAPTLNTALSLADSPVYSDGDRTVTITLKRRAWSDGEAVTAQDVVFWLNLDKVEKLSWAGYSRGALPDDIVSVRVASPARLSLELSGPVDENWFTYDELSQITPFPMAWDVAAAGDRAGSQACATASYAAVAVEENSAGTTVTPVSPAAKSCAAVDTYLEQQSGYNPAQPGAANNAMGSWATNKMWQVVDGPFQLSSADPSGKVVLLPNRSYPGPVKPSISQLVELPYSTPAAELTALAGGQLTVGYLPYDDLAPAGSAASSSGSSDPHLRDFTLDPWYAYGVGYVVLNFASSAEGGRAAPLLGELYFRQALQLLVDQPGEVATAFDGYALPSYGPVPAQPTSPFVSTAAGQNRYPYDPDRALELLRSHGWAVRPGGTSVCLVAQRCGVPRGTRAVLELLLAGADQQEARLVADEQASFARAGIDLVVSGGGSAGPTPARCSGPSCTWMAALSGDGIRYLGEHYPTGEKLFASGGALNVGSYSSTQVDALIRATLRGRSDLTRYDAVVASLLPVIWQPEPAYQLTEVAPVLHGVTPQSPFLDMNPENWYLTKS